MWNSGSEVISRSSAVSSIQYGNPSPAQAYARWVCMTSLDRPGRARRRDQHREVVGRRRSSAARVVGPAVRLAVARRRVRRRPAPSPSILARRCLDDESASAASVTTSARPHLGEQAGELRRRAPRVGRHRDRAERGERQASRAGTAASSRAVTTTRSPRRTPASRSRSAARATWRAAPAKVSVPSSVRSQTPSGLTRRRQRRAAAPGSCPHAPSQMRVGRVSGRRCRCPG